MNAYASALGARASPIPVASPARPAVREQPAPPAPPRPFAVVGLNAIGLTDSPAVAWQRGMARSRSVA